MTQQEFKQQLRENLETNFVFTKKDGIERKARGTLNFDMIPESDQPKGSQSPGNYADMIKYYDLDKEAWRSFHWEQFVEVL